MLLKGIHHAAPGTPLRLLPQLLDVEKERLPDMDAHGIDVHLSFKELSAP